MAPTFCSTLSNMIRGTNSSLSNTKGQEPPIKPNKRRSDYKKDRPHKENSLVIKTILKKTQKATRLLPTALMEWDSYNRGLNNCVTCNIHKEDYKKAMKDIRIIGLLVDSALEKEQIMLIENSYDNLEIVENESKVDSGKTENHNSKINIEFHIGVSVANKGTDHSLQCALIKLQRNIGELLVQVCFVKSNNLVNDDRNKKFNISSDDLQLFKFEYTNLTDKIILLFGNTSGAKMAKTSICIACVKESLYDINASLAKVLKSGRNLRLTMKNLDNIPQPGQCCRRSYFHIHAEAQGKPIVLKYSRDFKPKETLEDTYKKEIDEGQIEGESDGLNNLLTSDCDYDEKVFEEMDSDEDGDEENTIEKKRFDNVDGMIQDKRASHFDSQRKPDDSNQFRDSRPFNSDGDDKSHSSLDEDNERIKPNKVDVHYPPSRNLENLHTPPEMPVSNEIDLPKKKSVTFKKDFESDTSLHSESFKDSVSNEDQNQQPTLKSEGSKSSITGKRYGHFRTVSLHDVLSVTSSNVTLPFQSWDSDHNSSHSSSGVQGSALSLDKADVNCLEKDNNIFEDKQEHEKLYCGCNFDQVFIELGIETNRNSQLTKGDDSLSSNNVSFESGLENEIKQVFQTSIDEAQFPIDKNIAKYFPEGGLNKNTNMLDVKPTFETKTKNQTTSFQAKTSDNQQRKIVSFSDSVDNIEHQNKMVIFSTTIGANNNLTFAEKEVLFSEQQSLKEITHSNKNVERFLQSLGKENLLMVSTPSGCCRTNTLLAKITDTPSLPLTSSLHSLPLDDNDLIYIASEVEKQHGMNNKIDVPVVHYEPEKQGKVTKASFDSKNKREFAGTETFFNRICRRRFTGMAFRRSKTCLPTIIEEEDPGFDKGVKIHQEISSKPMKSKRNTIPFKVSTELRYCTVQIDNLSKIISESCGLFGAIQSFEDIQLDHNKKPNVMKRKSFDFKTTKSSSLRFAKAKKFNIYSNHAHSQCGDNNVQKDFAPIPSPKSFDSVTALEEMIMLSTMYLPNASLSNFTTD